jgi:hypothetical protein
VDASLVEALRARRSAIRRRWDDLLRVERANTPLAHPDTLIHLLDWSLDELLAALAGGAAVEGPAADRSRPACPCGRNPFLNFFVAGEQALLEALVLAQTEILPLTPALRDGAVAELHLAVRERARSEVEAICSVCQRRGQRAA